ncbi:NAD(P)H dependent flavin oxidoreductase family protein [Pseudomonas gingeri]|uniref:M24 family metallopeptidase n=1 Tax=Pseudomonas gingeri TaxID=117681 RepID=A0A7Y8CIY6_9PSED|nr:NAD(P)H dependent flavin oxidoreductase family protein [Pseudomonas gingeri]NWB26672.1 M24 family metallopeptidase [Pseudomonas gingeri]NWC32778.1 M24 family metallopeptidase [Pseudomonas gingeri]NWD52404.1 M24 family metallopeptidase [Pseudomonas gingeri]
MNYPKLEVLMVLVYRNNDDLICQEVVMNPHRHVIELSPSGKTFSAGDELLLDAMLASGLSVPFSCRRGACGSCKVKVLDGQYRGKLLGPNDPAPSYPLAADEMLLCQSHACADMRLAIPGWSLDTPTLEISAVVDGKRALSSDIVELVLQPQTANFQIRAGQYFKFRLADGDSRCFSVANLPEQDQGRLVFHIRRVPGGVFSEGILDALQDGQRLNLEGPFGACTWQPDGERPVVLFATGTGYAGIKPLLLMALAEGADVTLYWGGAQAADFYDREFLDAACAGQPRLRWFPVLSSQARLQQKVLQHGHRWVDSQVYACGNGRMIADVRAQCLAAGLPEQHFVAEAFVPSGSQGNVRPFKPLDPVWEKVGPRYSLDGMLAAREQSIRALAQIASKLRVGMTTGEALDMANQHLQAMGSSHTWHPTYVRFGPDTVHVPRKGVDLQRRLQANDIAVVDLGPVWDGYEGDYGDTFVFGEHPLHRACTQALHEVFEESCEAWRNGLSGRGLYDFAEASAAARGWVLERNIAGHRLSDFPHALHGPANLADIEIVPSEMVWVLEIQLRHPTEPVGGFFEDLLIGQPGATRDATTGRAVA